ncbi:hypothetical protein CFPU101_40460 [Chroococcus sp. FPU101]|nr:hypothetical protein CFPU101_40460 [Chroococcus sp. FPU101]
MAMIDVSTDEKAITIKINYFDRKVFNNNTKKLRSLLLEKLSFLQLILKGNYGHFIRLSRTSVSSYFSLPNYAHT